MIFLDSNNNQVQRIEGAIEKSELDTIVFFIVAVEMPIFLPWR